MKDIERLEEIIKRHKEICEYFTKNTTVKMDVLSWNTLIQLIENVIKRNRELMNLFEFVEKFRENNFSDETVCVVALKSNYMNYLKTDYISKSEVRNVFEKYEKDIFHRVTEKESILIGQRILHVLSDIKYELLYKQEEIE